MTESLQTSTMVAGSRPHVYVVTQNPRDLEASFIKAHVDRLPGTVVPVSGYLPGTGRRPALSQAMVPRLWRKAGRLARRQPWDYEITQAYLEIIRANPGAVLAEYGMTGVRVMEACRLARVPLVVHFHGYDASVRSLLAEHDVSYRRLFGQAFAIVAVSRQMQKKLIEIGAPKEKVVYNPYGVDCSKFACGDPGSAPPTVIATGYFVEKKAPHLTVLAFARAVKQNPRARLRMIGNGPLLAACQDLATALRLDEAITFLGERGHEVVQAEMRQARCFVQHSIEAQDGNSEGLPNVILEAGATGLPVVSTRHAGIVDAVVEGETGLLVDERDIDGMANHLLTLLADPAKAAAMGRAARLRIENDFSMQFRIGRLWAVLEAARQRHDRPPQD